MRKYEGIWKKRHLLASWILQIICAGIYGVLSILVLVASGYVLKKGNQNVKDVAVGTAAASGIVLFFCIVTYIFTFIEIIFYAKRTLNPVVVLVFAVLQTLAWTAYLVLTIIAAARGVVAVGDLILSFILVATSVVQLVFGARFTHMKRKGYFDGGHYARTGGAGGVEAVGLTAVPPGGVYYANNNGPKNPAAGYEAYRSHSPVPSYNDNTQANYAAQGVQMQPQNHQNQPHY